MTEPRASQTGPAVLVAGATGSVGGRVVKALLARGKRVRALVRDGTDPARLAAQGVEIARGNLLDPASLRRAMEGADAVVTTAAGYVRRRKGDSLEAVDGRGNTNLVNAARDAKLSRFVFTSILTCDRAPDVPHFWQKKLIEDQLEASGVPFVSLRPGAFFGAVGGGDFWSGGLRKGRMIAIGPPAARWTYIHVDDVADALARAVDEPRAVGRRIDLGMDRPLSTEDAAAVFSRLLGREIRVRSIPWALANGVARLFGFFSPSVSDLRAMFEYFLTGAYVADTTVQAELFGPVPRVEESFARFLADAGLAAPRPD